MGRSAFALVVAAALVLASGLGPKAFPSVNAGWPTFDLLTQTRDPIPVGQERGRWSLAFADEFNATELDSAVWVTCYWWDNDGCTNGSTNEQQWYLPEQVSLVDGALHLTAESQRIAASDGGTYRFASGLVSSGRSTSDVGPEPGFAFTYGFVEMRGRIPSGDGLWSAFWLLPTTHDSKPEIDVAEFLGQTPNEYSAHLHWRNEDGESRNDGVDWLGPDFSADWHTYAIEWTDDGVQWFVDGEQIWGYYDVDTISHEPMYLIANLAVGGDYAGPTNRSDFPATFEIDYIRVWQERPPRER